MSDSSLGKLFHQLLLWVLVSFFIAISNAQAVELEGTLVVVNKKADSVSFIDLKSRAIVATRATGKGPHEIIITEDGKWAVVTDYVGGNSLSVFDVEQALKVREIDLSHTPQPHGILLLKDQHRVAVSSEGSDSVVIANIHTGKVTQVLATQQKGSHMVASPADRQRVYTTNMRDNSVSEITADSGELLRQIPMPETPEAITINNAGTELWVGSNKDGLVTVFDVATGEQIKQWREFSWPYRIFLSLDEAFALVPDFRQDTLDIISIAEKTVLKRMSFETGTTPNGITLYPNDRTLFMSAYGSNRVYVIDIEKGETLFTLPTGEGPDGVAYSPLTVQLEK